MGELLADNTAVITGGASGIGRAIALRFAENGAKVVVADLKEEPRESGTPTHTQINEQMDSTAVFEQCDVSDPGDVTTVVERAQTEFGSLDVMVNNAGIVGPQQPVSEIDLEEYQQLIDINLNGMFYGSQAAATRMSDTGCGSIINISSIAGILGYSELSPYCASKGGIRLLTYSLAAELGSKGIRVNAIHPGVIETTMTKEDVPIIGSETGEQMEQLVPLRRFGTPDEVAKTALYLASDLSSYVTGESIVVDGGLVNTA
ncbi:SDR family oxidoreductase [Haladaptatus pallidirubidus]|uniref:SDR family oxidoreductase n=1 Tax=Haladaptatus pallidirubidus TaxID=1008152 RepID=A0AAV3UR90_9EURY|nr:SDR family oxidoreductase [Haladaptatus pallidirubidus]